MAARRKSAVRLSSAVPQLWFESFQNWQSEFLAHRCAGGAFDLPAVQGLAGVEKALKDAHGDTGA